MKPREIFTWKFPFYHGLLPALGRCGPQRADALLSAIGRASLALCPPRRRHLTEALARANDALAGRLSPAADAEALAVGVLRFMARDYLLDTDDDASALALFETTGHDALTAAIAEGRGAVLVGSHFGGHLAALHWLYRNRIPLRLMVQRPRHVSQSLKTFFDRDEPDPQSAFFLRRSLNPTECVSRLLRCRAALRSGKAIYLPGDIPWQGPNTRNGLLLGQPQRVLSVWADLAQVTVAPIFYLFCSHLPGGRLRLTIEAAPPSDPSAAVTHYLSRLDSAIAASPADAVAHLLWPCYGPPRAVATAAVTPRPSRRAAAVPHS